MGEIKQTSENHWIALKNGNIWASMFLDLYTKKYEIWPRSEGDPIKSYKSLARAMKAFKAYIED